MLKKVKSTTSTVPSRLYVYLTGKLTKKTANLSSSSNHLKILTGNRGTGFHACCLAIHIKPLVPTQKGLLIYTDTHLSHPVEYIKSCLGISNILCKFALSLVCSLGSWLYFQHEGLDSRESQQLKL